MIQTIDNFFQEVYYMPSDEEYRRSLGFFSNERNHIRDMFKKLSWDVSEDEQAYAVDYLAKNMLPSEYIYLVFANDYKMDYLNEELAYLKFGKDKGKWENAAKTIVKIGWPKVEHIIIPLFCWLLDPNWPGSALIYQFLLSLPRDVLQAKMKETLNNPQLFKSYDYEDLKGQIEDLCLDAKIQIEC